MVYPADKMLVKVHLLRHDGERLPAGDVRARPMHVGWIRLFGDPGNTLDRAGRVAVLQLPEGRQLELYDAQLIQWDGRGLILSGEERTLSAGSRRLERHRQAWWCKPVDSGESIALPIMPKSLALEGGSETDWIDNLR